GPGGQDRDRPRNWPPAGFRLRRARQRRGGRGRGRRAQREALRRSSAHRERGARARDAVASLAGSTGGGFRPRAAPREGSPAIRRRVPGCGVVVCAVVLAIATVVAWGETAVPWESAGSYEGEVITVEGDVARARLEADTVVIEFSTDNPNAFRAILLIPLI